MKDLHERKVENFHNSIKKTGLQSLKNINKPPQLRH